MTWSGDLRLIPNGVNPALAISAKGHVGFLYQTLTNSGATWESHIEISDNGFAGQWWTAVMAVVPSNVPVAAFQPYLGDYVYLQAVGKDFHGIFSANNTPDRANFPDGVVYQRNANFGTHTLLDVDNITPVGPSIDPFYFKVTVKTGIVATAIANDGFFGNPCLGSFVDELLTINNSGFGRLTIFDITGSSEFQVPGVQSYPAWRRPRKFDRSDNSVPTKQLWSESRDHNDIKRRPRQSAHDTGIRRVRGTSAQPDHRQRR